MSLTITEIISYHLVKLAKTRSFENYVDDRLSNKAQRTMEGEIGVLKSFDKFCVTQYEQSRDEIIQYVKGSQMMMKKKMKLFQYFKNG